MLQYCFVSALGRDGLYTINAVYVNIAIDTQKRET